MKNKRKSPEPNEPAPAAVLIKRLGSTDAKARNRALRALLSTWLPSQSQIAAEDMRRLWKGLFYCVWHSDKAPEQTRLADSLSGMVLALPTPIALEFFSAFLLTMRREWGGIDFLRLDKFYLLIRRFVRSGLELLRRNSWGLEMTFLDSDSLKGNGVNYHVASVFLEEFKAFLPLRRDVVEGVLVPFVRVVGCVSDKVLVGKVKGCLFDELVKAGSRFVDAKGVGLENDDAGLLGPIAVGLGFSGRFYELGSSADCIQGNRKVVFGLHEAFMKLERDCAALKLEVVFPDAAVGDVDEEEIPQLVPIENSVSMDVDGSVSAEAKRARKKAKKDSGGSGKKDKKNKKSGSNSVAVNGGNIVAEIGISNGDLEANGSGKKDKKNKKSGSNSVAVNGGNIVAEIGISNGDVEANGSGKKDKKKKNKKKSPGSNLVAENGGSNESVEAIEFNDSVISNLRMQFEKVAKEGGLDKCVASCCDPDEVNVVDAKVSKKRKRDKSKGKGESQTGNDVRLPELKNVEGSSCKTGEKSGKKVTFSMNNNLVWKPQNPLPPEDLRLPASVTPRGSALKKGVPPGPIREVKRARAKLRPLKKSRKVAPGPKRIQVLKSLPA